MQKISSARKIDILKVAYCGRLSRPRDYLNRVYNIKSESRVGGGGRGQVSGRVQVSEKKFFCTEIFLISISTYRFA